MLTKHAQVRSQQRGIPTQIQDWLLSYGEEVYDHQGGIVRYFSKRSVERIERTLGRRPLRQNSEYLRSFLVESHDGKIVTVGKRYKRVWRP